MYLELNTSAADLEMSTRDTGTVTNTTDTVIMKNISYTTAEDATQNEPFKQVPARTDRLIMSKASAMYLSELLELSCYNLIHTDRV